MAKVLGIGGLFFKSQDPEALREWYGRVLGFEFSSWGGVFFEADGFAAQPGAGTVFTPVKADSDSFEPSKAEFMFNLVVDDLAAVLARAKLHGVEPVGALPDESYGRFAHILDPEGRKIELWEPEAASAES